MERAVDGVFHVAVGEDDVRTLAAQLVGAALERLGGVALDQLGRIDVAGEGDLVDVGVDDHRVAGRLAHAVDDVDDAGGEAGLLGEGRDAEGGQRGLLGGLHDDRVAAGERRPPLPRKHEEREVPRDDLPDDADRLAQRVGQEVAAHGDRLALDLVGPAGVVAERVDRADHVAARVADRLAAVDRLELREFLGVLLDQVGELEHQLTAVGGVHLGPRPLLEGGAGGLDGAVHVGRRRRRHLGQHVAGRGVERLERAAAGRIDELVVDEQPGLADGRPRRALHRRRRHDFSLLRMRANTLVYSA